MRRGRKAPQWLRLMHKAWRSRNSADIASTSMDLCDAPNLNVLLGGQDLVFYSRLFRSDVKALVGWGRKWSGQRAVVLSQSLNKRCLLLEDGFLRSVGRNDPALSVVFDDKGVYYDASQPSKLEDLINCNLSSDEAEAAQSIAQLWRQERVSKYNETSDFEGPLPTRYVLVIDQVAGDLSINYGAAGPAQFAAMLDAALVENPDTTIILKTHPDVAFDPTKGHFDLEKLKQHPRIQNVSTA